MSKRYIALTRRSVDEKNRPGASHEYQLNAIQQHYKVRDWKCVQIVSENITGWKNVERTKLNDLYQECSKRDDIDYVLVQVWDRFYRNMQLAFEWIEKFKNIGIEVNSVEQWIDYNAHSVNTMLGIYLGMAADESHKISERVKNATYVWMSRGYWCKSPPTGYKKTTVLDENMKRVCIPDGDKSEGLKQAFELIGEKGMTVSQARKYLSKEGYKFSRSNFYKLVENPFYAGMIVLPKFRGNPSMKIKGKHQGLVSIELFERTQRQLNLHKFSKDVVYISESEYLYPLKGSLLCTECGKSLYGNAPAGRSKRYPYYDHNKCGVRIKADVANDFVELALSDLEISNEQYLIIRNKVQSNIAKETQSLNKKLSLSKKELERNHSRKEKLSFRYLDDEVSKIEYDRLNLMLNDSISKLEIEVNKIETQLKQVDSILLNILDTMKNISSIYKNSTSERKRLFLQAIFPKGFEIDRKDDKLSLRTAEINKYILAILCKSDNYKYVEIEKESFENENLIELATEDKLRTNNIDHKQLLYRLIG